MMFHAVSDGNKQDDETESMASGISVYSDTSSMSSAASGYSLPSSLSKKTKYERIMLTNHRRVKKPRQHKKRVSGKEGSQYEDEYLMDTMRQLIPNAKLQGN